MLGDDVDGELAVLCADVESIGIVMRRFGGTVGCSPGCGDRVAAGRTVGKFIHRAEMKWTNGEAILQGVITAAVFSVAAASHGAVVADVGKGIAAAGRIIKKHRTGAAGALTTESQCAEMRGSYPGIDFVIEGLARARAVDGVRIAFSGKAVVNDVSLGCVGEKAGIGIDARGSIKYKVPAVRKLFLALNAQAGLLKVVRRDEESMLKAVSVDQRRAFIVIAILR